MDFEQFDVVVVPFPFTDRRNTIRRPALILSAAADFGDRAGHSVMAMVTSVAHAAWPLDVSITDLASAGLPSPSKVRMKLFTLDHRLVIEKRGRLAQADASVVERAIAMLFALKSD